MGSIDGVNSTHAGWRGKNEVVVVEYDPKKVEYSTLLEEARKFECASKVFTHSEKQQKIAASLVGKDAIPVSDGMKPVKLSEQQYYLRNSVFQHLPLTELQATRINASLYKNKTISEKPVDWLSPRQLELLESVVAAKKKNATAFRDLYWPDDDRKLISYHDRLIAHLQSNR